MAAPNGPDTVGKLGLVVNGHGLTEDGETALLLIFSSTRQLAEII